MALGQSALLELMGELKLTDVTDRIRVATETLYQELIDAEAAALIGAAPFERSPDRTPYRNGARPRTLTITARELELRIPKLRQGTVIASTRSAPDRACRRGGTRMLAGVRPQRGVPFVVGGASYPEDIELGA
ncbi:Transposase, Mutator family [Ruaniaceae bacterium KH17]|nr:Transposase, Mutator family [Ruaniaceae bacterium KH17]